MKMSAFEWAGVRRQSVAAALALVLSGCGGGLVPLSRPAPATLAPGSPLSIESLALGDAWMRHHLILGEPAAALDLFAPDRQPPTSDALLGALHQAILRRQSGELQASNDLLEWAAQEADRRAIRSASRTAASFIVSDRVLEYTPTPTETAMIPFYRLMNYLELGDADGAAVEARRISELLDRLPSSDCRSDVMLRYVSGLAFERAGEMNDAAIALRKVEASLADCGTGAGVQPPPGFGRDLIRVATAAGLDEVADSARAQYAIEAPDSIRHDADSVAEVIVLVERGFVVHRTGESLHVPMLDDDIRGLTSEDGEGIASSAAFIAGRLLKNLAEREMWGRSWDDDRGSQLVHALSGAHILKLAWPGVSAPATLTPLPPLSAGVGAAAPATFANLSSVAVADLERERAGTLARLVARAVTKFLVAREVEARAEEKGGEVLGFLAARAINLAGNEMERPDTRSWTLLPAEIAIARVVAPAGRRTVYWEGAEGEETREIGTFELVPGERRIVTVRMY